MLFHKLILLLPAVLPANAAPTADSPATPPDFHSLAGAGSPPPLDSRPPVTLDSAGLGARVDSAASSSCTTFQELYGVHRWTYVEARWCITQTDTTTTISQELQNAMYFLGGAWYTGGNHRLSWVTKGKVGGVDGNFDNTAGSDGVGTAEIGTLNPKLASGDYDLILDFHLEGPYWGEDAAIDAHVEATGLHLD
ncbi:hypothetical protein V500_01767 [Pseudogymnoascus sp. VKM F-4518 (FW-2643)]|nr:hypothetical protein V500_01767 [Pseudogymnoascus sp. VKM F-4518 (FW-2643)]